MSDSNQVILRDVTKRYGSKIVLDKVSLTVEAGQTAALIGPSGGGKSTILRCINGLNSFDGGDITVGPHVLRPNSPPSSTSHVRRLFGMIFQDFQLFPHMTALQNVMEAPLQVQRLSPRCCRGESLGLAATGGVSRTSRLLSQAAFRRPEATCGHCSCAGDGASGPALR